MERATKPTDPQLAVLRNLAAGRGAAYGLEGRSAHGGLYRTLWSMQKKGWIVGEDQLTDAGRKVWEDSKR